MATTSPDPSLSLPRILALHGGGVNAAIFRAQLRSFLAHPSIGTKFRLVFVDAPFYCDEGVGVRPVYETWGPFRRWFRWLATHDEIDAGACQYEIEYCLDRAMESDAGSGPWVGLLGFSQGAKLAGSLLYDAQLRGEGLWKFAVILAGRAPLVCLSDNTEGLAWMQSARGLPDVVDLDSIKEREDMKLRLPTVHVHGLKDEGLELHRRLVNDYCAPGSTTLVEWDGNHRIPLKKVDVDRVVDAILKVAGECGI